MRITNTVKKMSGYLMRVLISLIMKRVLRSPEEVDRIEIKREEREIQLIEESERGWRGRAAHCIAKS